MGRHQPSETVRDLLLDGGILGPHGRRLVIDGVQRLLVPDAGDGAVDGVAQRTGPERGAAVEAVRQGVETGIEIRRLVVSHGNPRGSTETDTDRRRIG